MPDESAPGVLVAAASVSADADWDTMTDPEKIAVFKDWRSISDARSGAWLKQAREAFRYVEGDQVPEAMRGRLDTAEGRTLWLCLVGLRMLIHGQTGTLMAAEPEPHFEGMEYGDTPGAAIASKIVAKTASDENTLLHATARDCVDDQHICGLGVMCEYKKEDVEFDLGNGEIAWGDVAARRVDPELIRLDPNSRPGNQDSIGFLIELEPVKLPDLRSEHGDAVQSVKGRASTVDIRESFLKNYAKSQSQANRHEAFERSHEDPEQGTLEFNRIAIKEHIWYVQKKRVKKVFRKSDGGTYGVVDITTEEVFPQEKDNYRIVHRTKRIIRYACMVEDILLEDGPTKQDQIPYPLFYGEKIAGYHLTVGLIYHLIHVVNLLNGLATNMVNNAIRTSSAGRKWEESALSPTEKNRVQTEGHLPGFNFEVRDGYIDRVRRDEPGQISEAVYRLWSDIQTRLYDQLSGQYAIQKGGMPYDTSGRGILALGNRADTGLAIWKTNIERALTSWLRLRWKNIQLNFTFNRVLRISGKISEAKTFNALKVQKDPITGETQVVDADSKEVFFKDLSATKFDMSVSIRQGLPLTPEERRQQAIFLFEAHLVPRKWFVGPEGMNLKNGEDLLEEANREQEGYQLLEQTQKAVQINPQLIEFIQNPELLAEIMDAATPALTGIPVIDGQAQVPAAMMSQMRNRMRGGNGNGNLSP